jgi:hypothetical protein
MNGHFIYRQFVYWLFVNWHFTTNILSTDNSWTDISSSHILYTDNSWTDISSTDNASIVISSADNLHAAYLTKLAYLNLPT